MFHLESSNATDHVEHENLASTDCAKSYFELLQYWRSGPTWQSKTNLLAKLLPTVYVNPHATNLISHRRDSHNSRLARSRKRRGETLAAFSKGQTTSDHLFQQVFLLTGSIRAVHPDFRDFDDSQMISSDALANRRGVINS